MDLKSSRRWYDYSRARDAMFGASDTKHAPGVAQADRKRNLLNIIHQLLSKVPMRSCRARSSSRPPRQKRGDYVEHAARCARGVLTRERPG